MELLKKVLLVVLIMLISASAFANITHVGIKDAEAQTEYYAYIRARDFTQGADDTLPITMDDSPSGHNTPWNFTGLTGSHTFRMPVSGSNHPLAHESWMKKYWDPLVGEWITESELVTDAIVVNKKGNYTAQYQAYTISSRYSNGTAVSVQVSRVGDPGGPYPTPKTFTGISGTPQTFNVPATTPAGIAFKNWEPPFSEVTDPVLTVSRGKTYTAIYEDWDPAIYAYSRTKGGYVNVTVQRSGDSNVYYTNGATGKTFNNLGGTPTFTINATDRELGDPYGNPFCEWDTGATTTSLTVLTWLRKATYIAYFEAITIKAYSYSKGLQSNVAISKNGTATGFSTPHTFAGLAPPWNFTVPLLDTNGHPFQWWNTGEDSTTITVTRGGNFSAYYRLPPLVYVDPPFIQGLAGELKTVSVKIYNLTDGWIWNPTKDPSVYDPLGNLYSLQVKVAWDLRQAEFSTSSVRIPVETYNDGVLHKPTSTPKESIPGQIAALATSGSYLYAGSYLSPGLISKINLADFSPVATMLLSSEGGENLISSLAVDGPYLYAGLDTSPGKVVKIDLATFTTSGSITLSTGENNVKSLAVSGSWLYAGLDTLLGGKIARINLTDFTRPSTNPTLTLVSGEDRLRSLAVSGSFLYAGTYTSPGKVVRVRLSDFSRNATLTLSAGPPSENNIKALAVNSTHLFAGLAIFPGRIVPIRLSDFSKGTTLALLTGENDIQALAVSGSYLYAGLNTAPGKVAKVNLATWLEVSPVLSLATNDNYIRALQVVGTDLYAGVYIKPAAVSKINLNGFTLTSKIVLMKEYSLQAQSIFNSVSGTWPDPYNNNSLTAHPTIVKLTFKIVQANTPIPVTLSDILLEIPPSSWVNATDPNDHKFDRVDISRRIAYTRAFDYNDLKGLQTAYGSKPGNSNWKLEYDFNRDNIISVIDLQMLGKYFGKSRT